MNAFEHYTQIFNITTGSNLTPDQALSQPLLVASFNVIVTNLSKLNLKSDTICDQLTLVVRKSQLKKRSSK